MKKETRVTIIFWICVIAAIFGVLSVATGIQNVSYSTMKGTEIVQHGEFERIFAGLMSVVFGFLAYGLKKKKKIAWAFVSTALAVSIPWLVVQSVYLFTTLNLPVGTLVLGFLGECLKIGILVYILWKWWLPTKQIFEGKFEPVAGGDATR